MRVLVVDDEEMKRDSLAADLRSWGHEVAACADGEEALGRLQAALFDVIVADLMMPGVDGMELLKRVKQGPNAAARFIMITAYGSIPVAVEAMRRGAFDFLTKPFDNRELVPVLRRIAGLRGMAAPPGAEEGGGLDGRLVGQSAAMGAVRELVEICARTESNVLLCGETGTGKDLIASLIHKQSPRHASPFVKVCCAVFPQDLLASELYGHERGAFTGADRTRPGRLDLAAGGTLYLDDVDDIPLRDQVKLLRVIEDRVYERVGGGSPIQADLRILAATKRDLLEMVGAGAFREDLYYRLHVMCIDVPPLRERRGDIPLLAAHLLRRLSGDDRAGLPAEAAAVLMQHDWPGNVRELRNVLERAWLLGRGEPSLDLLAGLVGGRNHRPEGPPGSLQHRVGAMEEALLRRALAEAGGNKTAAARALGLKPSTFRDRLRRHGLGGDRGAGGGIP